ncbi:lipocalin-like domain-containing protein [Flavobacterium rhizosphaerae]|uniref:Lipocalin-like domain-containing protein n=1 Tax=Flavobacterium rhizosphaerae TaxID=3163298 RepID=A0ABW8YWF4_9FLAO
MRIVFLCILFSGLFFSGCSEDDGQEKTIDGMWVLKHSADKEGAEMDFDEDDVVWIFNTAQNSITVQNSVSTPSAINIYAGVPSGTYIYRIAEQENDKVLFIDNMKQGIFAFDKNNLVIRTNTSNDIVKVFER